MEEDEELFTTIPIEFHSCFESLSNFLHIFENGCAEFALSFNVRSLNLRKTSQIISIVQVLFFFVQNKTKKIYSKGFHFLLWHSGYFLPT